jgi:hypothetical protein
MFAVAALATLALAIQASAFTVSTPASLTLCQDAKFDIIGGNSGDKYTAYFVHSDNPCGDELFHISDLSGDHFNWKVNVTAGTSIMIALDNGHDDEQWTGGVTVTGSDTSCLTATGAAAPSGSSASTSTTRAATFTAPINAGASSAPSGTDASTSGASRVFGVSSVLAVLGAAAVGLTL